jgi:small glutamine-rich tetratricopeptide repeat-containing protein alpha
VQDCERAIVVDPGYVKAYSRLGFALYQQGKTQESVDAYGKGLALDPNNTTMKQGMENAQHKLSTPAQGAGGAPDLSSMMGDPALSGLMGSLGGNPNVAAMMQNPAMMQMAQQMMSDPAAMQSMMGMMGGMMGGQGGGAPDPSAMAGLMNNPQLAQMANDLAANNPDLVEQLQNSGMGGMPGANGTGGAQ